MSKLRIETYRVGVVMTNCYFVINEESKEMFIIDPGDSADRLAAIIKEQGLHPVAILLTHGHFDHAMAANELAASLQVQVYAHEKEKALLEEPYFNRSGAMGRHSGKYHADIYVRDGEVLSLAGFSVKVLFTPGHTPGSCCYYIEEEHVVFSGDTLFLLSVGRTDFPGSSASDLVRGIREKLMVLPDDTIVLPGHDDATTIGQERKGNPFI